MCGIRGYIWAWIVRDLGGITFWVCPGYDGSRGVGSFRDVWHQGVCMGLDCQSYMGYKGLGLLGLFEVCG